MRPFFSLPFRIVTAALCFRRYRFEIWHSFNWSSDFTEPIIAWLSGAKWIYTKKNMNWNRRAWRVRTRLASRVVARNSTMLKTIFANPNFRQKARLVRGGVDTSRFLPRADNEFQQGAPAARNERFAVLCAAHLVRVKGQDYLIRAIAATPGVELWLAGRPVDPTYANELISRAQRLGLNSRLRFLGGIRNVEDYLQQADVFVLPTTRRFGHEEGCPVALLEAMACGLPCIATRVAGSTDLIEDGVSGIIVEPENSSALAEAIERLRADPALRARLGAAARKRVVDYFDVDHEARAMQHVYEELV
jgi:glycosyltransferase involved in cell wall biosynthesis